jgi:hypothetical protein
MDDIYRIICAPGFETDQRQTRWVQWAGVLGFLIVAVGASVDRRFLRCTRKTLFGAGWWTCATSRQIPSANLLGRVPAPADNCNTHN